jgi:tRNA modification GTPase
LAEARTQRTAAILLDQYRGALRRAIEEIETDLGLAADRKTSRPSQDRGDVRRRIEALLARAAVGLHLTRPWQVAVAGRPNVGKSSLINAVAGFQRAIVHPTPGTTRDIVTVETVMDGWPVELADTAGLHDATDVVEQAGIALARERLAAADLVLLVFDRSRPWSEADASLVRRYPGALVVHNKCDLPPGVGSWPSGLELSALGQDGIEALCQAMVARLVPALPPPGEAAPFLVEQVEQIAGYLAYV